MAQNFWDEPLRRHHQLSDQIHSLVSPLVEGFHLSQFCYFFIKEKGEAACLSSYPAWTEFYHYEGLFHHNPFLRSPKLLPEGLFFSKFVRDRGFLESKEKAHRFGIGDSMVIGRRQGEGWEGFLFSLKKGDEDFTLLMNELPLIRQFCEEFKIRAKRPLLKLSEAPVNLPFLMGNRYESAPSFSTRISGHQREKILSGLKIENPPLSKREKETLLLYLEGETAKSIALLLSLSPRTVEDYLLRIKEKLSCFDKRELIQKGKILKELGLLSPYYIRFRED